MTVATKHTECIVCLSPVMLLFPLDESCHVVRSCISLSISLMPARSPRHVAGLLSSLLGLARSTNAPSCVDLWGSPVLRCPLEVPPDFSICSIDSTISSGSAYVSLNEEQKAREMTKLQHMIRDFVMEFLQGVYLDAVLEEGPCSLMVVSH